MKSTSLIILSALVHSAVGFAAVSAGDKPQAATAAEGAAVQRKLSKEEMTRLEKAVAGSDLVAAVTLGAATSTGAANVHQAKITEKYKGEPDTSAVFADVDRDNTLPPAARKAASSPFPKIAPGDYVVILVRDEVVSSIPRAAGGKTYNYSIKFDDVSHLAWQKDSPEAAYVRELLTRKSE